MAAHVAYIKPTLVSESGVVVDKNDTKTTLQQVMTAETQMRIVPDPAIPNSVTAPTIEAYIQLESTSGFAVVNLTNTTIVTQN